MSPLELIADAILLAVVLSAAAAGLCAHLLWLLVTDRPQLAGLARGVVGL